MQNQPQASVLPILVFNCPILRKFHFQTFELPKNPFSARISILNILMKIVNFNY